MPELLSALNYDDANILAKTKVLADSLSGQKILSVENSASFTAGKSVVIGDGETAEIVRIDVTASQQITSLTNLKFKHYRGETVRLLLGNSIKFYVATNVNGSEPDNSTYTVLQTVAIVPDQLTTSYLDPAGSSSYWYKYIYFDSDNTSEFTDLEDSVATRGGVSNAYVTVQEVRIEAGLQTNRYISDHEILSKIVKAQSEVNASLRIGRYTLPLTVIPGIVENATLLLAAGYLLFREYGAGSSGGAASKEGNGKIAEARILLKSIESGQVNLTDDTGVLIPVETSSSKVSGYPDDTAEDLEPSEGHQFHITDTY